MITRLYALSDDASERLASYARGRATTTANYAADELTPLDHDEAVERMARALLARRYGGRTDGLSRVTRSRVRDDARAALNALLQED